MTEQASQITLAIGDHVRLKTRDANQYQSYQISGSQVAFMREPADGLILSIRDLRTGTLVKETSGELGGYVFELVFDNTFSPKYASTRNAPRTADRPTATPGWNRLRATLREMAGKDELLSTATPGFFTDGVLSKMLDGWKVIKVRAEELVSLEKPEAEAPAAE